jgi:hypothetical protein
MFAVAENSIWVLLETKPLAGNFNSVNNILELFVGRPAVLAWRLSCTAIGFFASAAQIPEAEEDGKLTGVFNFRTRKFDDGTDPYGWYEEDL